ncbi:MAG TPA: hypothetical protein VL094_10540 [Sphingomonadaceae bacterium]|nr:hypothetical protein [Sphingomonadaceae bacterium]
MVKRKKGTLPAFIPVPRIKQRSNGWSDEVQRDFIEALADSGSVRSAARAVNRAPEGAYQLRRHPEAESFRKAWQAALDLGVQKIEDVAMDRALNGTEVPVYSYGKLIGSRIVYNDRLLMFMLRNRAPGRFTGGAARALNAVDRQALARHKKQWRKEWERERAIADCEQDDEAGDAIIEKIDQLYMRWLSRMSPATREAYTAFRIAAQHDKDNGFDWSEQISEEDHAQQEEEDRQWAEDMTDSAAPKIDKLVEMRPDLGDLGRG